VRRNKKFTTTEAKRAAKSAALSVVMSLLSSKRGLVLERLHQTAPLVINVNGLDLPVGLPVHRGVVHVHPIAMAEESEMEMTVEDTRTGTGTVDAMKTVIATGGEVTIRADDETMVENVQIERESVPGIRLEGRKIIERERVTSRLTKLFPKITSLYRN